MKHLPKLKTKSLRLLEGALPQIRLTFPAPSLLSPPAHPRLPILWPPFLLPAAPALLPPLKRTSSRIKAAQKLPQFLIRSFSSPPSTAVIWCYQDQQKWTARGQRFAEQIGVENTHLSSLNKSKGSETNTTWLHRGNWWGRFWQVPCVSHRGKADRRCCGHSFQTEKSL